MENPNYVNDLIPALDLTADRMMLFEQADGDEFLAGVERHGDLNRADPEGPAPFNMPSWRKSLTEDEVDSLIAYLVSIYEFEEYE